MWWHPREKSRRTLGGPSEQLYPSYSYCRAIFCSKNRCLIGHPRGIFLGI